MKKLALLRSLALAVAVTCGTSVIAQEDGTPRSRQANDSAQTTQSQAQGQQQGRAGQARDNTGRDSSDRSSGATQPGLNDTRQTGRTGTNTTTADAAAARGSSQMDASTELQKLFSGQLIEGNKAEVELGKIAQQRAENDQVKQFASKMVTEHQNLNQKLTSLHQQPHSQTGHSQTGNQSSQAGGNQNSRSNAQGGQQNQSAQSSQGHGSTSDAQTAAAHSGAMQGDHTLQQLTTVMSQACENKLQMTKQMLEQHKGQEFDMAYMGQQIVAHTAMLAHLKALQDQNVGDQQFRQLVDQAAQSTEQHLQQAKQIADQLKNKQS